MSSEAVGTVLMVLASVLMPASVALHYAASPVDCYAGGASQGPRNVTVVGCGFDACQHPPTARVLTRCSVVGDDVPRVEEVVVGASVEPHEDAVLPCDAVFVAAVCLPEAQ